MRLGDLDALKEEVSSWGMNDYEPSDFIDAIDAAPTGECKTCRHRDPEDKKCYCGGLERQGCKFPVSDDYFCKFYEKGGVEC